MRVTLKNVIRIVVLATWLVANVAIAEELRDKLNRIFEHEGRTNEQSISVQQSGDLSAEGYCTIVESNKTILDFSKLQQIANQSRLSLPDYDDPKLSDWVTERINEKQKQMRGPVDVDSIIWHIKLWGDQCALKHIDDEVFYFFYDERKRQAFKAAIEKFNAQKNETKLDARGNLVKANSKYPSLIDAIEGEVFSYQGTAIGDLSHSKIWQHKARLALAFPLGEKAIESTGVGKAIVENLQQEARGKKYLNSPDGKLALSYQYIELIDQCVERDKKLDEEFKKKNGKSSHLRPMISGEQYTNAKKVAKRIESALVNKLEGSKAEIWKNTTSTNLDQMFIANKSKFYDMEMFCTGVLGELDKIGVDVLGKRDWTLLNEIKI